jgi:hypothetical protein
MFNLFDYYIYILFFDIAIYVNIHEIIVFLIIYNVSIYIYTYIILCIIMCLYISWIFSLTVPTYRCNCSSWWPETSSCSWSKLYRCCSYLHSGLDPSVGKSCINRVTLIILHLQSVSFHHVNSKSEIPYGPYVACFWVPPDSAFGLCSILCLPTQKGLFRAMEVSRSILGGALIKQLISGRIEAGWVIWWWVF